jgi:hypothetical protein
VIFKGAADTRKHMEAQYELAKGVLSYLVMIQ